MENKKIGLMQSVYSLLIIVGLIIAIILYKKWQYKIKYRMILKKTNVFKKVYNK